METTIQLGTLVGDLKGDVLSVKEDEVHGPFPDLFEFDNDITATDGLTNAVNQSGNAIIDVNVPSANSDISIPIDEVVTVYDVDEEDPEKLRNINRLHSFQQTTDTIMMVRPEHFSSNPGTIASNHFQNLPPSDQESLMTVAEQAKMEFDGMVAKLRTAGVTVVVVNDSTDAIRPDCVFPNNWITTHSNGVICTYPMLAESRRIERRPAILKLLKDKFEVSHLEAFEHSEEEGRFLEGTGSMILDRTAAVVYACAGPRTDPDLLLQWTERIGYQKSIVFNSVDQNDQPIYHTNVMMAIGTGFAIICSETIRDPFQLNVVEQSLMRAGKEIVRISYDQMNQFAGNALEVQSASGEKLLVMSEQAQRSLDPKQLQVLHKHISQIISVPIYTIEKYGGGSARCMMCEIFLRPRKED